MTRLLPLLLALSVPLSVQQEDNCPSQSLSKGQSVCQDDNGLIDCRLKEMLKDPLYSTLLSCPLVATAEACTGIPALYSACCDACSAFGPAPEGATCRNDDSAVIPTLLEQDYTCMRVAQLIPCYMMSIDEVLLETFETGCMRTWYDQCMSEEEQSASVCAVPEVTEPEAEEEGAGDIESLQEADGGEQDAETEGETEEKECEVPPAEITECTDSDAQVECGLKQLLEDPMISPLLSCGLVATAEACTGIPALYSTCCDACSDYASLPEGATCGNDESAVVPTLMEQDYTCEGVLQLIPCYMLSFDESLLQTYKSGCTRTWYDKCAMESEKSELISVCDAPEEVSEEGEETAEGEIQTLQVQGDVLSEGATETEAEEGECQTPPAEITECTDSDAQVECGLKQLLEDPMISPLLSCGLVATAEACTGIPALYSTCCDACSDYASLPEGATCGNDESAVVPTLMEQDYTCEGVLQLIPCYMLSFDESLLQTYKSGCTRTWYDKCAMESEKSELASVCDAPEEGGSGIQVLQFQKDPSNFFFDVVQDPVAPEPEQSASVPPQQRRLR